MSRIGGCDAGGGAQSETIRSAIQDSGDEAGVNFINHT